MALLVAQLWLWLLFNGARRRVDHLINSTWSECSRCTHLLFLKEVSGIWCCKKFSRRPRMKSRPPFVSPRNVSGVDFTASPLFLSVISQPPEWTQAAQCTQRNDVWAIVVSTSYKKEVDEGRRWLKAPLSGGPCRLFSTLHSVTTLRFCSALVQGIKLLVNSYISKKLCSNVTVFGTECKPCETAVIWWALTKEMKTTHLEQWEWDIPGMSEVGIHSTSGR